MGYYEPPRRPKPGGRMPDWKDWAFFCALILFLFWLMTVFA